MKNKYLKKNQGMSYDRQAVLLREVAAKANEKLEYILTRLMQQTQKAVGLISGTAHLKSSHD
jgi:hypothetical protein